MSSSFFPPGALGDEPSQHAFVEAWYAARLRALHEGPILASPHDQHPEAYRFLWLRTFHHPLVFRLDVEFDGAGILNFKEASGAGGYAPGDLIINESRPVLGEAVSAFRTRLDELNYWQMPSRGGLGGCDGAQWVLEAVNQDKYHIVERWGGGEIREAALMLVSYSGLEVEPVY